MGNNNEIRVILGSLRYKSAPDTDISLKVPFVQTSKEIIEFERNINIELEEVYNRERQKSTTFRPATKFQVLFKNSYSGQTNYEPFENNLYYLNSLKDAFDQCSSDKDKVAWVGLPQYHEFDFIRPDYNVTGYTVPPNEHVFFEVESASTYNWNFFMSYAYDKNDKQSLNVYFKDQPSSVFVWVSGDGIPFIIQNNIINGGKVISFKCPVKHGLSVGEFVKLSIKFGSQDVFPVYSLGLEDYGNEEYVFNIFDIGYNPTLFSNLRSGTFKRVLDEENESDTTSQYYIRKHKILTNVNDAVLVKAGFEKNVFGVTKKYETSGQTPNLQARISVKEDSQSYSLSFNSDIDISTLRDNQMRPITELFFTVIWKGYFGWMNGLQKGWEFNLPLTTSKQPNNWWDDKNPLSKTLFPTGNYNTSLPNQPNGGFIYVESLKEGDILDGDFCEWNSFEQKERVISNLYHKFKYNNNVFSSFAKTPTNRFGYYYQPHHPITLRVYSDYIETGDPKDVVDVPDYSYYSTKLKEFIWRDIYEYGFIDSDGRGVSYPFLNGTHYPFKNTIFRIIPEGTNYSEQNFIKIPVIDDCE